MAATLLSPNPSTSTTAAAQPVTAKGWFADPRGEHKLRYHDGAEWTEHTTHYGPVPCPGCSR